MALRKKQTGPELIGLDTEERTTLQSLGLDGLSIERVAEVELRGLKLAQAAQQDLDARVKRTRRGLRREDRPAREVARAIDRARRQDSWPYQLGKRVTAGAAIFVMGFSVVQEVHDQPNPVQTIAREVGVLDNILSGDPIDVNPDDVQKAMDMAKIAPYLADDTSTDQRSICDIKYAPVAEHAMSSPEGIRALAGESGKEAQQEAMSDVETELDSYYDGTALPGKLNVLISYGDADNFDGKTLPAVSKETAAHEARAIAKILINDMGLQVSDYSAEAYHAQPGLGQATFEADCQ